MKRFILIKNQEARIKVINRFCLLTSALSCPYIYILYTSGLILSTAAISLIIVLFLISVYLNKKSRFGFSKILIVINTNFAVGYFSSLLGFDSGIHLFLFSAPLITYLLFDFTEKIKVFLTISGYVANFIIIYTIYKFELISPVILPEKINHVMYFMNFAFSITLCFFLIIYFANNNSIYINLLKEANVDLEEHQVKLKTEIVEKTETHKKLTETLKEKETLLSEIHHRVKNNLAVISGLVELQNFYVKDEVASAILKESRNRIKSIALLHEKFYESKNLDTIEIRSYVDELIYYIKLSFTNDKKNIKIHTQLDNIDLPMAEALPFSLLLNELITNSYKHAFKDKSEGNIYLTFSKINDEYVFHYKDDGCGFDSSKNFKETSLGMNLIEAFSKQLKAKMTYSAKTNEGVDFKLNFKQTKNK